MKVHARSETNIAYQVMHVDLKSFLVSVVDLTWLTIHGAPVVVSEAYHNAE